MSCSYLIFIVSSGDLHRNEEGQEQSNDETQEGYQDKECSDCIHYTVPGQEVGHPD
jgi:hypothetical protein